MENINPDWPPEGLVPGTLKQESNQLVLFKIDKATILKFLQKFEVIKDQNARHFLRSLLIFDNTPDNCLDF